MKKEPRIAQDQVTDAASFEALTQARELGVITTFDRVESQSTRCSFGTRGLCCRLCHMGPCRISAKSPLGVCGADADTIVARNFLREVAGGIAAHADHGRHLVLLLKGVAEGGENGYAIRDERALRRIAARYGIECEGREVNAIAGELAEKMLGEYSSQEEPLHTLTLAPAKRLARWRRQGMLPTGIDRTVVEAMHRTHIGVDHDYRNLLQHTFRVALADGWGGSRIASQVSDILFGTPQPLRSAANLGVLRPETVNIVVHGHEPEISEMLAVASQEPEIVEYARKAGAEGVTLAGICCTANEILMRHGIAVAGNFLQQELAIVTGLVETMFVDVQCCMPSLPEVAAAYHTQIVSTSDIAKTVGVRHRTLDSADPLGSAKSLIREAIDNFVNRDRDKVTAIGEKKQMVAGFSVEAIRHMLGGSFRASFRPLNDAVMAGRIRGVAGIVGCNNPRTKMEEYTTLLTRELIRRDVLVLKTGCAAICSAKAGIMTPETALEAAGPGLREVCEAVGMPPVLHMGSCVDCSRLLEAATEMVAEGGLGDDLDRLPAVGVAPEWMSEKAVTIACYFVASGIDVVLGQPFHVSGSERVSEFLRKETRDLFGASFHDIPDPAKAADRVMELIEADRDRLGINQRAERKLWDMADRRAIHV